MGVNVQGHLLQEPIKTVTTRGQRVFILSLQFPILPETSPKKCHIYAEQGVAQKNTVRDRLQMNATN